MPYSGVYCADGDLLIGDLALKDRDSLVQKHIDAAADTIDSKIGFAYVTPVTSSVVSRAGWLLLRRIAVYLASGTLLMETDQAGEGTKVHDYALYLLQQADSAIEAIVSGDVNLRPSDENEVQDGPQSKVLVNNLDTYSMVESFYGWASQPPPWYLRGGVIPYGR